MVLGKPAVFGIAVHMSVDVVAYHAHTSAAEGEIRALRRARTQRHYTTHVVGETQRLAMCQRRGVVVTEGGVVKGLTDFVDAVGREESIPTSATSWCPLQPTRPTSVSLNASGRTRERR